MVNVWLRDTVTGDDGSCSCGCGKKDCGCQDSGCKGGCCGDTGCNGDGGIYPEEISALQRDYSALWDPLSDLLKQLSALVEL